MYLYAVAVYIATHFDYKKQARASKCVVCDAVSDDDVSDIDYDDDAVVLMFFFYFFCCYGA